MESLENILHQPRESGPSGLKPHWCHHPHKLPPAGNREGRVLLAILRELQLPVPVGEVQGSEVLGFHTPETLETTRDIHKHMEVIPDYLVGFPHVDDKPQLLAMRFFDGKDGLIVRTHPILLDGFQRQKFVYLLVDEVKMRCRNRKLLNISRLLPDKFRSW